MGGWVGAWVGERESRAEEKARGAEEHLSHRAQAVGVEDGALQKRVDEEGV